MKSNKAGRIALFILVILATIGLGCVAYYGIGPNKDGSIFNIKKGLDLAGGVSITYQIVGDDNPSAEDLEDTMTKLRMKAETYSTEAQVYKEGDDRITVEIPEVTDAEGILAELGKPGSLYFISQTDSEGNYNYTYMVTADGQPVYHDEHDVYFIYATDNNLPVLYDTETMSAKLDEEGNVVPYDGTNAEESDLTLVLLKSIDELKADGSIILEGGNVVTAKAGTQQNQTTGAEEYVVQLGFDSAGAEAFKEATTKAYANHETIAIYYDGQFISVPSVSAVIGNGEAVISGNFDDSSAKRLASKIKIGAMKLELEELRSNIVGAQLGSDAISTSLKAAAVGLIIVALIMICVYFLPGLAAVIALVMYTAMIIVTLSLFNTEITLTLPGIAGIILSIGMAVDANVIIFARIREELATGKTLQSSVDIGFKKALSAIVDGNITTLIAAVILILMGSGTVRGFAQTLMIGIILSMFTALVITRILVNGFIALGLENLKLYGVAKEKKAFDFVSKGGIMLSIAGAIIVVGLGFMAFHQIKSGDMFNYSLEFQGGSVTTADLGRDMTIQEIDSEIVPYVEDITGDGNVQVQKIEGTTQVNIKTRALDEAERATFNDVLTEQFGVEEQTITSETISATISGEMRREAIVAVLVAVAFMLLYIWLRFSDIRFGISSVAALLHDVLIVLSFYAIARVSVGSTFIACMLTIVGYSINATIVIFDRVRENKKAAAEAMAAEAIAKRRNKKKGKEAPEEGEKDLLKEIVNKSISQTLSRSILTSVTTLVMVVCLYIMGVSSIKEFALPLIVGIIAGGYSSVFIAGIVWRFLRIKFEPKYEEDDD